MSETASDPVLRRGFADPEWRAAHPAGTCLVCGQGASKKTGYYCDEHRPPRSSVKSSNGKAEKLAGSAASAASSSKTSGRRTGGTGKVSDDRATKTLATILMILTVILMTARLRRAGIRDRSGELAEDLSLTDEEAMAVARPIARWSNSTVIGARVIGPIARNEDIVSALYAIYQYQRRTGDYFSSARRGDLAPVVPIHGEPTRPEMPTTSAADQVIIPEEPLAPPEYRAVAQPIEFGPDGRIVGT